MKKQAVYHGGAKGSGNGPGFTLMDRFLGITGDILLQSIAGNIIDVPLDLNLQCDAGASLGFNSWLSFVVIGTTYALFIGDMDVNVANCTITITGRFKLSGVKSGATQAAAGAQLKEIWRTQGHASLPNGVLMIGL